MSVSERKDQNGSNVVRFGIAESVLSDLGYDVENIHIVRVQFGFGDDLGTVLIRPGVEGQTKSKDPSAYVLSRISRQSRAVALSCAKIGIDFATCAALPCEYAENGKGSFLITIPNEIMENFEFTSSGRLRQQKAEELDAINKR
jgi:hypothetical protein